MTFAPRQQAGLATARLIRTHMAPPMLARASEVDHKAAFDPRAWAGDLR